MNFRRAARGWLLWLALILPIAQAMAGVHALSHLDDQQDEGVLHLTACDLCLAAAHLSNGAPAAEPLTLPDSTARHALPVVAGVAWHGATRLGLPPARAPPASA